MKLEITKEKVLEAASKCSTAKATLETLFPEAFKTDRPVFPADIYIRCENTGGALVESRFEGFDDDYRHVLWLSGGYTWQIKDAKTGGYCLIPTKILD